MPVFRVVLEREECISCGACVENCPDSFEMADDEWAHLKNSSRVGNNDELGTDDLGCRREAAEACPVNIIHISQGETKII